MADDVLGGGLDRDIDAVLEGLEVVAGAPGIIHDHRGTRLVGLFGDSGDVRHLEGQGSRRLDEYDFGFWPYQLGDATADHGVVVGGLDTKTGERAVAKFARRTIGVVDRQHMVAGLE